MKSYQRDELGEVTTWIDVGDNDDGSISREEYEQLVALTTAPSDPDAHFTITRAALQRLLQSVAIGLLRAGN